MSNAATQGGTLVLIRHAPVAVPGRLTGRWDVDATIEADQIARAQALIPAVARVICSPARRCVQTAAALWPARPVELDPRLWEQSFGEHDGRAYTELPDLGRMTNEALAQYAPPGGESFADVCDRVHPALSDWAREAQGQTLALVVHAGVIRAALGWVLAHPAAALSFEVDTLSITTLRVDENGPVSIQSVNVT